MRNISIKGTTEKYFKVYLFQKCDNSNKKNNLVIEEELEQSKEKYVNVFSRRKIGISNVKATIDAQHTIWEIVCEKKVKRPVLQNIQDELNLEGLNTLLLISPKT